MHSIRTSPQQDFAKEMIAFLYYLGMVFNCFLHVPTASQSLAYDIIYCRIVGQNTLSQARIIIFRSPVYAACSYSMSDFGISVARHPTVMSFRRSIHIHVIGFSCNSKILGNDLRVYCFFVLLSGKPNGNNLEKTFATAGMVKCTS